MLVLMGLRTLADIQAEYNAVHAAYLKAAASASHTVSTGSGSRTQVNQNLDILKKQLTDLTQEYAAATGGGLPNWSVTPLP